MTMLAILEAYPARFSGFSLHLLLYVIAAAMFLMHGLGVPEHPRGKWLGWGLFLWLVSGAIPW